ncbi:MAG: hypothetical protein KDI64_16895, partial [Candidatus Accumulibacter sp.]|nr:hypothetical protein [Accumulibacter sp.]
MADDLRHDSANMCDVSIAWLAFVARFRAFPTFSMISCKKQDLGQRSQWTCRCARACRIVGRSAGAAEQQ